MSDTMDPITLAVPVLVVIGGKVGREDWGEDFCGGGEAAEVDREKVTCDGAEIETVAAGS